MGSGKITNTSTPVKLTPTSASTLDDYKNMLSLYITSGKLSLTEDQIKKAFGFTDIEKLRQYIAQESVSGNINLRTKDTEAINPYDLSVYKPTDILSPNTLEGMDIDKAREVIERYPQGETVSGRGEGTISGRYDENTAPDTTTGIRTDRGSGVNREPTPVTTPEDWNQYTDPTGGYLEDMYNALMELFSQKPVYEIPQEVFDIMNLSTQTAETLANLFSQQRTDVLGRLDVEGMRALDILGQSKTDQLREANLMQKQMMGAYEGGMKSSMDILSQQAYGGLPGEQQYLENLQTSTASAVNDLLRRGGGTGQSMGAIADIYGGQQGEMRNLAAQRAQYQATGMQNLAGAHERYGQGRASIYETGAQTRLGIRSNMDQVLANTRIGLSNQWANAYQSTTGMLGSAIDRGSVMMQQALGNIADYRDKAYNINFYEPYVYKRQFIVDEMRRTDTYGDYINLLNQQLSQTYNQQYQGIQGQMTGAENIAGSIGSGLGNYFTGKMLDAWNPQTTAINNPVDKGNYFDYISPGQTNFNFNPVT